MDTSSEKYRLIKKPGVVIYEEAMALQDAAYGSRWEAAGQAEGDLKYDVQLLVDSKMTVGQWTKWDSKDNSQWLQSIVSVWSLCVGFQHMYCITTSQVLM
jgi:hypothetical protein